MSIVLTYYYRVFRDSHGDAYVHSCKVSGDGDLTRYIRYVGQTLNGLAPMPAACDLFLDYIEAVEKKMMPEAETGGNDVVLHILPDYIQVSIMICEDWIDQPEGRFSLETWKKILTGWKEFMLMPQTPETTLEVRL